MNSANTRLATFGGLSAGFDSSYFDDKDRFRLWAPIPRVEGISKGTKTRGKVGRIVGIGSSEVEDEDEDVIEQEGLEWDYFIGKGGRGGHGLIILEHPVGVLNTIGYPVSVKLTEITSRVTNKLVKATEVEGDIYLEDRYGRRVWKKARVMQRAGGQRSQGFSIEGGVKRREGKRVKKGRVKWLAVTAAPRNHDSWWQPKMPSAVEIKKSGVGYPLQGVGYEGSLAPLVGQSMGDHLSRDHAVMTIAKKWPQSITWAQAELIFDQIAAVLATKG